MAKEQLDTVYRIVDVVGVSEKSWEDAGRNAVETAAESLRDLRVANSCVPPRGCLEREGLRSRNAHRRTLRDTWLGQVMARHCVRLRALPFTNP